VLLSPILAKRVRDMRAGHWTVTAEVIGLCLLDSIGDRTDDLHRRSMKFLFHGVCAIMA
jgi:hypothetical protein